MLRRVGPGGRGPAEDWRKPLRGNHFRAPSRRKSASARSLLLPMMMLLASATWQQVTASCL
jgi:hypothetical protein